MPNLKTVGIFKKKITCNFVHVGFGVHSVKNRAISRGHIYYKQLQAIDENWKEETHFRQIYLNTKAFVKWVYFKRIIAMCFLCGFWGTYTCNS